MNDRDRYISCLIIVIGSWVLVPYRTVFNRQEGAYKIEIVKETSLVGRCLSKVWRRTEDSLLMTATLIACTTIQNTWTWTAKETVSSRTTNSKILGKIAWEVHARTCSSLQFSQDLMSVGSHSRSESHVFLSNFCYSLENPIFNFQLTFFSKYFKLGNTLFVRSTGKVFVLELVGKHRQGKNSIIASCILIFYSEHSEFHGNPIVSLWKHFSCSDSTQFEKNTSQELFTIQHKSSHITLYTLYYKQHVTSR